MKIFKNYFPLIAIGLSSFLLTFILHFFGAFSSIESKIYDMRFKIRGPLIGWDSKYSKSKIPEEFIDLNNNKIWDNGEEFKDIGIVFFPTNPHALPDLTLYFVAKYFGIKTIISHVTYIGNYHVLRTGWETKLRLKKNLKKGNRKLTGSILKESNFTKILKSYNVESFNQSNESRIRDFFHNIRCIIGCIKLVCKSKLLNKKINWGQSGLLSVKNPSLLSVIKVHIENIHAKQKIKNKYKLLKCDPDLEKKYIYHPLHFQPESNTIPEANIFSDQLLIVSELSKNLPKEIEKVYVKEHPVQFRKKPYNLETIWARNEYFYEEIVAFDNVVLIDPYFDSESLIRLSEAVATANGSSGWEALKINKPALLFGNPWYSACQNCGVYSSEVNFMKEIERVIKLSEEERASNLKQFLSDLDPYVFNSISTIREKIPEKEENQIIEEAAEKIINVVNGKDKYSFIDNIDS